MTLHTEFDAADYLKTDADIVAYLKEALLADTSTLAVALVTIARAKGIFLDWRNGAP